MSKKVTIIILSLILILGLSINCGEPLLPISVVERDTTPPETVPKEPAPAPEPESTREPEPAPEPVVTSKPAPAPTPAPTEIHDVAVTNITAPSQVERGTTIKVTVVVKNEGNVGETFEVTLKRGDRYTIGTLSVFSLAAGATKSLTFNWNTANAWHGSHLLRVTIPPVHRETDGADNTRGISVLVQERAAALTPPSVSITHSPVSPTTEDKVTFTTRAEDTSGIEVLYIYVNNNRVRFCTSSPCTYVGGPYVAGTVTYEAKVHDKTGNDWSTGTQSFIVGDVSVTQPTTPAPPSNLSAQVLSQSSIRLTWSDNSNNETGLKLERSLSSSSGFTLVDTVGAGVTSFTNTGLNAGTTYYYRVRAYNSAGYSAYSNTTSATTSATTEPTLSFTLTVMKSGTGSGRVTGPGINYGADGTEEYASGTSVTLTAVADSGSTFTGWSGCDSSSGSSCTVLMNQEKLVTAHFALSTFPVTTIEITSLPATDDDGSYTLEWTVTSGLASTTYFIQEDSSSAFSNPTRYPVTHAAPIRGSTYSYSFSGKANGTYFYRVAMEIQGPWSEPASIVVSRPSSATLRIVNNTHWYIVSIKLNGVQQVEYPYGIEIGKYYDFVRDPGRVSYDIVCGFYKEDESYYYVYGFADEIELQAGETFTLTCEKPTIGHLLSNFNQNGTYWKSYRFGTVYKWRGGTWQQLPWGEYWENERWFLFGYDGSWKLYERENLTYYPDAPMNLIGYGTVILTSWPDYELKVKFKLYQGDEEIEYYCDYAFPYSNGPPDWRTLSYFMQP